MSFFICFSFIICGRDSLW